jgi:hypothetical protein
MADDYWVEYWGGELAPADRWGRCPIRGNAVKIVHETLCDHAEFEDVALCGPTASLIVDRLIEAEILPDEMAE